MKHKRCPKTGKTINKDGTLRRGHSGKKPGAVSFIDVSLTELIKQFRETDQIRVSRKWAEANNLNGHIVEKVNHQPTPDIQVTNFD